MNIISYRGPCSPGGVSGTLARLYANHVSPRDRWWFLSGQVLKTKQKDERAASLAAKIPDAVISGHYRFCNNFIWPVMHGLPEYANYDLDDQNAYHRLNLTVAGNVLSLRQLGEAEIAFVNDYQFALLPALLSGRQRVKTFWHIPWPVYICQEMVEPIMEIAEGLLGSDILGFHTVEYANNFLRFVDTHLKAFKVDFDRKCIVNRGAVQPIEGGFSLITTEVVVRPLGIDAAYWQSLALSTDRADQLRAMIGPESFIISVDRADYTKGIKQRLKAIDKFFHLHPEFIGKVKFVQVCQATRNGLPAFDQYYGDVRRLSALINSFWNRGSWRPIVWIDEPLSAADLAHLYGRAEGLLVSAVRDGLNLTVKEFIACTRISAHGTSSSAVSGALTGADGGISTGVNSGPGVLLLSPGAGVWQEVSRHALAVAADVPEHIASQLGKALKMTIEERMLRARRLKSCLDTNTLADWWQLFGNKAKASSRPISYDNFA